jgi:hypothetical protein
MLAAISSFERDLMLERQRKGIAIAKSKNVYQGRKSVMNLLTKLNWLESIVSREVICISSLRKQLESNLCPMIGCRNHVGSLIMVFVQAWMLEISMMCEKQWRFLYRSETIFLKNRLRRY